MALGRVCLPRNTRLNWRAGSRATTAPCQTGWAAHGRTEFQRRYCDCSLPGAGLPACRGRRPGHHRQRSGALHAGNRSRSARRPEQLVSPGEFVAPKGRVPGWWRAASSNPAWPARKMPMHNESNRAIVGTRRLTSQAAGTQAPLTTCHSPAVIGALFTDVIPGRHFPTPLPRSRLRTLWFRLRLKRFGRHHQQCCASSLAVINGVCQKRLGVMSELATH